MVELRQTDAFSCTSAALCHAAASCALQRFLEAIAIDLAKLELAGAQVDREGSSGGTPSGRPGGLDAVTRVTRAYTLLIGRILPPPPSSSPGRAAQRARTACDKKRVYPCI